MKTSHVRGREETDAKGCYHTSYVHVWRAILNWLERKEANTVKMTQEHTAPCTVQEVKLQCL